jgi:hypothetical protein
MWVNAHENQLNIYQMPWKRRKKSINNIQISLRLLFVKLIITKGNDITNDIPNIIVNIIANIIHECPFFTYMDEVHSLFIHNVIKDGSQKGSLKYFEIFSL